MEVRVCGMGVVGVGVIGVRVCGSGGGKSEGV